MRLLILTLLVAINLYSWEFTQKNLQEMTPKQLQILKESYEIGKQIDLGYTLAAITVVETRVGKYMREENYCGVHQVSINTTKLRFNSLARYKHTRLCELINNSSELSAKLALSELMYWNKVRTNWSEVVMSYNGGWNTTKHGVTYLSRIRKVVKVLQNNTEWKK
mgnify:CR=1 FL=1